MTKSGHGMYILREVQKSKASYLLVVLGCVVVGASCEFVLIVFPKHILDELLYAGNTAAVLFLIISMGIAYFFCNAGNASLLTLKAVMEEKLKVVFNVKLAEKCGRIALPQMENNGFIEKISRARMAINGNLTYTQSLGLKGEQGFTGYFDQMLAISSGILKLFGIVYIIRILDWRLLLAIIIGTCVCSVCNIVKRNVNVAIRAQTAPYLRKNQYCNRILRSFESGKDIRLSGNKKFFTDKFSECANEYVKVRDAHKRVYILADVIFNITTYAVIGVIYLSLIRMLVGKSIGVGDFTMVAVSVLSFINITNALTDAVINLGIFSAFMRDYRDVMQYPEQGMGNVTLPVKAAGHTVKFEHVWYRYENSVNYVLQDINVEISPDERITIVGYNGAGKSTFVKLLCGVYAPTKGKITIGGINMKELRQEDIRRYIGAVFQDFFLFAMTISDNITFARNRDESLLKQSLLTTGIAEVIERLPNGADSNIMGQFEPGDIVLSGGELQKIAISRLFYHNTYCMELDEPTAALDPRAENDLYEMFAKSTSDNNVIYVSHRLASVKLSDRVFVFAGGRIVENGAHDELIKNNGDYRRLWDAQSHFFVKSGLGNESI